jgi:antirestriction protein ArdC
LLGLAGYECRWWATSAQIRAFGGRVRKGEHGTRIVFCRHVEKTTAYTVNGYEVVETFPLLKTYSVFNIEQTVGLDRLLPQPGEPRAFVPFAQAEAVLAASGADIRYGGSKAEYDPNGDFIRLPEPEAFAAPHEFYGTAFHELAHWTGHTSRLDRLSKNARFGSTAYAREELVAEIAGCFLAAEIGIHQSSDATSPPARVEAASIAVEESVTSRTEPSARDGDVELGQTDRDSPAGPSPRTDARSSRGLRSPTASRSPSPA